MTMTNVIKHAEEKFGAVLAATRKAEDDRTYKLAILRASPVFEDRPYMSITAWVNEKYEVCFMYGHYDLDKATALKNIEE